MDGNTNRQTIHAVFVKATSENPGIKACERDKNGVYTRYTRERKHFLCMREDFCRKARKDWPQRTRSGT